MTLATPVSEPLLVEQAIARPDVQIARHRIVPVGPQQTLALVRDLDFLEVRTPLLDVAMWARELPARLRGETLPKPPTMRLAEAFDSGEVGLPGWMVIGETDRELAIGAVGRVWQADIEWLEPAPADLATFDDPGWAKIGASFAVVPYGARSTVLTYDVRVRCTDDLSTQRFRRYWTVVRPVVGHILSATLDTVVAKAPAPTG